MYITESDLWMFEGIDTLKDQPPEQILAAAEVISQEVDEYCGTRFLPTEDRYGLDYCEYFHTRRRPLLKVSHISLNGRRLSENRSFYVYPESDRIEIAAQAAESFRKAIDIRYTFGYETVPATVKQVIVELLKLDSAAKTIIPGGIQSESWDSEHSYSMHSSKDMTPAELRKNILARLDIFKAAPYTETRNTRMVKVMVL